MSVFPVGLVCSTPKVRTLCQGQGKARWGGDLVGSGPLGALCPLASLSVGASPHSRLYLSLVLGNVNVTLLSKQAK